MPKVGKKHYPYTHAGRRAAKEDAKKKGKKVRYTESTYESIIKLLFEKKEWRGILNMAQWKNLDNASTPEEQIVRLKQLYAAHRISRNVYLTEVRLWESRLEKPPQVTPPTTKKKSKKI